METTLGKGAIESSVEKFQWVEHVPKLVISMWTIMAMQLMCLWKVRFNMGQDKSCKDDLYCFTVLLVKSKLPQFLCRLRVCKAGTCFCAPFVSRHTAVITSCFRGRIFPSLSPLLTCTDTLAPSLPALFLFCNPQPQHLLLPVLLDVSSLAGLWLSAYTVPSLQAFPKWRCFQCSSLLGHT